MTSTGSCNHPQKETRLDSPRTSLVHSLRELISSQDKPRSLTPLFSNSFKYEAIFASSIVHTGMTRLQKNKSLQCKHDRTDLTNKEGVKKLQMTWVRERDCPVAAGVVMELLHLLLPTSSLDLKVRNNVSQSKTWHSSFPHKIFRTSRMERQLPSMYCGEQPGGLKITGLEKAGGEDGGGSAHARNGACIKQG
ncbi:hypothetical protein MLD38_017930 [Melastoma candidum]|uniref:Uncharacterized protein n=1 Tax=Melastoma candidum TaxID=119954 RepID=A0ACB9QSE3_9MYRT|nr:hypothetical protein MLD38_017930 [Melastoma candidum]